MPSEVDERLDRLEETLSHLIVAVNGWNAIRTTYMRTLIVLSVLLLLVGGFLSVGVALFMFTDIGSGVD